MIYLIFALLIIPILGLLIAKEYQWAREKDNLEKWLANPDGSGRP